MVRGRREAGATRVPTTFDDAGRPAAAQFTASRRRGAGAFETGVYCAHPAEALVGAPVFAFSPDVGFLQMLRSSKSPMNASLKSAPSKFAFVNDVPVSTAFAKIAPRKSLPSNDTRSTTPLLKSAFVNSSRARTLYS